MRRTCLIGVALLAACSRGGFDPTPDANRHDLARDGGLDVSSADGVSDGARDMLPAPPDGATADTAPLPDASGLIMSCIAPEEVGTSQPANLDTIAMRIGGLQLVARANVFTFVTSRPGIGQAFGPWARDNQLFSDSALGDLSFVDVQGRETLIYSNNDPVRTLSICRDSFDICTPMTLRLGDGQLLSEDVDGPSTIVLPSGDLLMAHNIGPGGQYTGDIFLARLINPDLADLGQGWVTAPVPGLGSSTVTEDDPALSPDGLTMVFEADYAAVDEFDLYVVTRNTLTDPFSSPRLVEGVNTASNELQAELVGSSELFFVSDRSGAARAYRTSCSLTQR